ncbi:alanine-zipper protein [uncultured Hymenobacter sp.]|uniref:alanine-zipper protein n=1 Tax=uncultured Hymenobacter sp. TaxID=170016 RepID=UPI0035CB65D7
MDHNERFDQLENLMTDMHRRVDRLEASQERTNTILDSVVDVLKIVDQRFQRVEDVLIKADERQQRFEEALLKADERQQRVEEALLKADERQQRVEDTQSSTLRLLMQQSENLTAAFRTLETHDGRIQKLEGNQAA